MHIRPATVNDSLIIAKLYTQCGYSTDMVYIREQLSHSNNPQTFVAVNEDDKVVGVIEFHLINTVYRPEPAGHISALVVDENFRGQGIGRHLLDSIERVARSYGCAYLEIASHCTREQAHRFYEKAGLSQESHCYFRKQL